MRTYIYRVQKAVSVHLLLCFTTGYMLSQIRLLSAQSRQSSKRIFVGYLCVL